MTQAPWRERSAGVLLHLRSLPPGEPLGQAIRLARRLARAGFRVWQLLPIGPSADGCNPFSPASAFAGDVTLLSHEDAIDAAAHARFRAENEDWLADWCLFRALKRAHAGAPWWKWPVPLRRRDAQALAAARRQYARAIEQESQAQFRFHTAWQQLRQELRALGLALIGDIPMFVARDSADVWSQRALFEADADGALTAEAGVPPDAFAAGGQLWRLPPYRWDVMAATGFGWWKRRFEVQALRHDLLRIDHFRGLVAWWRVAPDAPDAVNGHWTPGPGRAAVDVLEPVLRGTQLVAEDLGVITEDVVALRHALGLPGMRVLQFAFDGDPDNPHLPQHHGSDTVCYTGTHDNDTTLGWWLHLSREERERVARVTGYENPAMPKALVDLAWSSPAPLAVVPMQDLLGLGSEARMNRPGRQQGNWQWSLAAGGVPEDFEERVHRALAHHGRIP